MKTLKILPIAAMTLLASLNARAEGSVAWSDVRALFLSEDPAPTLIEAEFDMSSAVGDALRLGRQSNFGGARIGPYHFDVVFKGKSKPAAIDIETELRVLDDNGKETDINSPSAATYMEKIRKVQLTF